MTFLELSRGFRRYYALSLGALALAIFFAYLPPLVTRATIDEVLANRGASVESTNWLIQQMGGPRYVADHLWIPTILIACLAALSATFMYLKGRWAAFASEGMIRQIRHQLYNHLQHLTCKYHDEAETGDLVQRCSSDVDTLRQFLAVQAVEVGRATLLLLTVIPLMVMLDWRMALLSIAGAPFIIGFCIVFFLKIKPTFQKMDEAEGEMTTVLQENLTGVRVVRAFARQDFERDKLGVRAAEFRDRHFRLIQLLSVFWPLSDVMVFTQLCVVLLSGAHWAANGSLSIGTLVAFMLIVSMYVWPMRHMGRILADLGKAVVAFGRIREVLSEAPETNPGVEKEKEDVHQGMAIEAKSLTFAYEEDQPVLQDISFRLEPGETLAVMGPSGSGKSTLSHLLLRFYDGYDGSLQVDGEELSSIERKRLRSRISVIMQEPFLYSKTLYQNVQLGRGSANEDEVHEATRCAQIHESILEFDEAYETLVGERGVTLSGGQRQRVALARALLQRPGLLILDDALSAVDTETETNILGELGDREEQPTTIIIAHRVSTLRHADKILVLEEGQAQQLGKHDDLLAQEGPYKRLWQLQGES